MKLHTRSTLLTLGLLLGALGWSWSGWLTKAARPQTLHAERGAAVPLAANIIVTSNLDGAPANNGACTLREAIINANNNNQSGSTDCVAGMAGLDNITFSLGAGPYTINVAAQLPTISEPINLDGSTGNAMFPRVELNGAGAGTGGDGLRLAGGSSTIRAFVINRFADDGIEITLAGGNTIQDCYIGLDATGANDSGNNGDGIIIVDAPNNLIGGTGPNTRNVVSGNNDEQIEIRGLMATNNQVKGNFLGTNAAGTAGLGGQDRVRIDNAPNNLIGGTEPGARNIIADSDENGIAIRGADADGNRIEGNYIGTDVTGTVMLGNSGNGVQIQNGSNNVVGGTMVGAGNIISNNGENGIHLERAPNNRVEGNYIGTDVTGELDFGNSEEGVDISLGSSDNVVGGTLAGARNVISGNGLDGVNVANTSNARVEGNYVGTDKDGLSPIPNGEDGVSLENTTNSVVGGTAAGAGNLISGNTESGVDLTESSGNRVEGNLIGTSSAGTGPLPNLNGVEVDDFSNNNVIGGTAARAGNVVAFNTRDGVWIFNANRIAVLGNSIFSNGTTAQHLGIDLAEDMNVNDGVTPNDTDDPDVGTNNYQNFPVLTCAVSANGQTTVQGMLNSLPSTSFRIEFFANAACDTSGNGEGQRFLGQTTVMTNSGGDVMFTATGLGAAASGEFITATATRIDMSNPVETSEFSACLAAIVPTLTINDVSIVEGNAGTTNLVFTVTLSGAQGTCLLPITVNYATANGTATAPSDFTPASGMLTFNGPINSNSVTQMISVPIVGDLIVEANETFFVNLTGATNATATDPQGQGTINNDDSTTIAITDVNQAEGQAGTTNFTFTVTLSNPSSEQVTVNFTTANGTATAGSDYVASSGTLTFAPGVTSQMITVQVNGELVFEPDETFFVNLSGIAGNNPAVPNPTFTDNQGQGTIVNDDAPQPGLTVSIADPFDCTGPGDILNVTAQVTNPTAMAQTLIFTASLPGNLPALPGTCATSVPGLTCVIAPDQLTVTVTGTLPANQTASITYQVQVGDATPGAQLCIDSTASFATSQPVSVQACTAVDCPPLGPGLPFPSTSEASDQKAGSVLVYNLYSSSAAAPNTQNTRISITNTNPSLDIAVHLFFVDGQTCSIADAIICLTKNQTATALASDLDPGTTGYLVAVASDLTTGCPVNFNFLIGDAYVKLASGHQANLGAEAFAALAGGPVACDGNALTAQLNFDGVSYNRAPRVLAASSIPARNDGNDTLLVVNRFGGNLATGAGTLTDLLGLFYDDAENGLSFTFSPGTCQFRSSLSSNFPRTTPRLDSFIPAGRTGWLRLYSASDIGLLGAILNYNATAGTAAGAFNQGRNLHKLTLTSTQTLVIPIFPANCLN